MNSMKTETFIGKRVFRSGTIIALGKLIQLAVLLLAAKILGVSEFGVFALALAIAQICSFVFVLGGQQGLTKIVSRFRVTKQQNDLIGIILFSLSFYVVAIFFLWAFFHFLGYTGMLFYGHSAAHLSFLAAITIWIVLREGISRGFSLIAISQLPHEVIAPVLILISIVFDESLISSSGSLILLWCGSYSFVEVLLLVFVYLNYRGEFRSDKIRLKPYEWSKELLAIQGASVSKASILRTDVLITGTFIGSYEAGLYSIAQRLAQPVTLLARTIFAATGSLLTEYHAQEKYEELRLTLKVTVFFGVIGSILYFLTVLVLGEKILTMIDSGYLAAFPILLILLLAQGVDSSVSPSGQFLVMCGYERELTSYNVFGGLVYAISLISYYEILSGFHVAVSLLVGMVCLNALSAIKALVILSQRS